MDKYLAKIKTVSYCFLLIFLLIAGIRASAFMESGIAVRLAGRMLLQVESRGEAWYVYPGDYRRYYLGRPEDAFGIMKKLSTGISDEDLAKLPIGTAGTGADSDGDGLTDALENALGMDKGKADSDGDGYGDLAEISHGYDPLGPGRAPIDAKFTASRLGRIYLQTEKNGEAWYVDPISRKRYFLSRPADAFQLMRLFGLGIKDSDLDKIYIGSADAPDPDNEDDDGPCIGCSAGSSPDSAMSGAADAIRSGDKSLAASYFIPEMKKAIEYTMDFLDSEGRLTLGNILSGSTQSASTDTRATYSNKVYFSMGGYEVPVNFYVEKQADGQWLLTNL